MLKSSLPVCSLDEIIDIEGRFLTLPCIFLPFPIWTSIFGLIPLLSLRYFHNVLIELPCQVRISNLLIQVPLPITLEYWLSSSLSLEGRGT